MIFQTLFNSWKSGHLCATVTGNHGLAKNRHEPSLSQIFTPLLLALLSSCGGTAPTIFSPQPQILPAQADDINSPPSMIFDGKSLHFQNDTDPGLTVISLPDSNAEHASGAGVIVQNDSPTGLIVSGDCAYSNTGVAASQGKWKFDLPPGCSMLQMSNSTIQTGQAIVLEFDVQSMSNSSTETSAEIIGIHTDGTSTVLTSAQVEVPASEKGWITKQISIGFGVSNQYAGNSLAVSFNNTSTTATVSLDSISLKVFDEKLNDNLIFSESWNNHCDQLWAGQYFWSNRLQDWQVLNQRLQTTNPSNTRPNRTTHRISTEMVSAPADFSLVVDTGSIETSSTGSYSGFLIGAGARMDYRSSALIHNRHGRNGGLIAGIDSLGRTFFLDHGLEKKRLGKSNYKTENIDSGSPRKRLDQSTQQADTTLQLDGDFLESGLYRLSLFAKDIDGNVTSSTYVEIESVKLLGNIALVSNPGSGNTAHWFDNWKGIGSKLHERPSRQFGPVLFSNYTVNGNELTVNAQFPPICTDNQPPPQQLKYFSKVNGWRSVTQLSIPNPIPHGSAFYRGNLAPTPGTVLSRPQFMKTARMTIFTVS